MVNLRDLIVFTLVLLGGITVFIGVGGLELQGSNASNILCSVPGVSDTSFCSASVDDDTRYELETQLTVGATGVDDSNKFIYRTSKDSQVLSLTSPPDLSVAGANDVVVDYVLRDDSNRIVSSNRKRLGDVKNLNSKDVTFSTGNLESGEYEVEYVVDYEYCSYLGNLLNDCEQQKDKISKNVEVPKLPLGEY